MYIKWQLCIVLTCFDHFETFSRVHLRHKVALLGFTSSLSQDRVCLFVTICHEIVQLNKKSLTTDKDDDSWYCMIQKKTVKFGQRLCHSAILSWLCVVVDCATEVHSRTPCHSWRGHIQARAPTWTCWRTLTMCYWRTLNCWHSWHKARRSHNLRSTCLRSDDGRTAAFEPNAISCDSYCSMFALACISANAILHPQCMYVYIYIRPLANILRWKVWKGGTWKIHVDSIWQHPITPGCGGSISWTRREKCIHALGRRSRHCAGGAASGAYCSSHSSLLAWQVFGFGTIVMLHSGNGLFEVCQNAAPQPFSRKHQTTTFKDKVQTPRIPPCLSRILSAVGWTESFLLHLDPSSPWRGTDKMWASKVHLRPSHKVPLKSR